MVWKQEDLLKEQPRRVGCGQGQGVGGGGASSTRLTTLPRFTLRNCPIQGQCAAWGNSQICPPGSPQAEESLRKAATEVKGKLVQEDRRLKPSPKQSTPQTRTGFAGDHTS